MILSFLLLLVSAVQHHASSAESSLSNKFQHTNVKEPNDKEKELRRIERSLLGEHESPIIPPKRAIRKAKRLAEPDSEEEEPGAGMPAVSSGKKKKDLSAAKQRAEEQIFATPSIGKNVNLVEDGSVKVSAHCWQMAKEQKTASGMARMLLVALFSTEVLLKSNLTGGKNKINPEAERREPLDKAKVDALIGVQDSHHEKVLTVSGDGTVHSPDFPHTYPRNKALVWRLVAAHGNMRIQLTFDERFGLEDPEDGLCKYDFVEIEEPTEGTILGRWCGSQSVPETQVSKGSQIRIRFISDEYFPSEPGFCIRYSLLPVKVPESERPVVLPPSLQSMDMLTEVVSGFSTVEEVMKYLEPDRWKLDMEDLYKPSWHVLGKSYIHSKKSRGAVDLNLLKEEVRLYSCTPRNFSVSLREELKRTDSIFWPNCLLVKRCGGNCACCHGCFSCQCVPTKVTKKFHEVLQLRYRSGGRGLQKSLTDVPLEHHEECSCLCKDDSDE